MSMNVMKMIMVAVMGCATALSAAESPRIVCLGGAVTETVWALGAGEQVVAVDDSSTYPAEAASLPHVGYYRMISAEGVLSLKPDLVLASEEAGPPEALEQLKQAGVTLERIPGSATVSGCVSRIRAIGTLLNRAEAAEELAGNIESSLAELTAVTNQRAKVLFVFARGAGTLNVSGEGTAAHEIIQLAGGQNAVTEYKGYRPMTAESVAQAQPDVVLITASGLQSIGGAEALWQLPGLNATPAGHNQRVIALDDLYLLGFGPRLPAAVRELQESIYP